MPIQLFPQLQLDHGGGSMGNFALEMAHADMFEAEARRMRLQSDQMERVKNAGIQAEADTVAAGKQNDTNALMENLVKRIAPIDPEKAQTIHKNYQDSLKAQMDMQDAKTQHFLTNLHTGLMLVGSGHKDEALQVLNQFAPPGQQIKDIKYLDKDNVMEVLADGSQRRVNIPNSIAATVDSKTLYTQAQENFRAQLRLQKEFPDELKSGEVVGEKGQKMKVSDLLAAYRDSNSRVLGLLSDPSKMITLKATDPTQYNKIMSDSIKLQDPINWIKDNFKVDITQGGGADRIKPGKKEGTVVPKSAQDIKTSEQKTMVEGYGETYDPSYEYREQDGMLQRRKIK